MNRPIALQDLTKAQLLKLLDERGIRPSQREMLWAIHDDMYERGLAQMEDATAKINALKHPDALELLKAAKPLYKQHDRGNAICQRADALYDKYLREDAAA